MVKALPILLSIVLGGLGIFAIILAFAYPSVLALIVGAIIILISIVSLAWGLNQKEDEETPKEPKQIKVKAEEAKVPIKITKPEPEKYKPIKPTRATVLAPNSIYCPYCGKQIPKDSMYCPNCGSYLEGE